MTKLSRLVEGLHQGICNVGPIILFMISLGILIKAVEYYNPCSQFSPPESWSQCGKTTIDGFEKDVETRREDNFGPMHKYVSADQRGRSTIRPVRPSQART
jgi:hypothetical protein